MSLTPRFVILSLALPASGVSAQPAINPSGLTVVLPASAGKTAIGVPAYKFWTPAPADIQRLEANLKTQEPSVMGYDRQYLGIIQGGRRLIYVNGFSSSLVSDFGGPHGYWRHQIVFVNDGGNDFFNTTYDPKTRRFSGLQFNGLG